MKAYMVRTDRLLEPFNEPARDCLVLNQTIADTQAGIFARAGVELMAVSDPGDISDSNEHLVLRDNLYFTPELLKEFVERSRRKNTATICALKNGVTTLRTAVSVQDVKVCQSHTESALSEKPAVGRLEFQN